MKYQIATGPAAEPVTLEEAKAQLRVEHDAENTLIQSLVSVCRRKVEQETGRALFTQTINVAWDKWPKRGVLELPIYPAASIAYVKYIDEDGALQTWDSSNYSTDLIGMGPRIVPKPDVDIPDIGDYPNAIQVQYTAGETTTAAIPPELKHAILVHLALLYERREDMPLNGNTPGVRTASWLQFNSRANLI